MPKAHAKKPPALLRLRVTAAAERVLRAGHPWVFAESIQEQNRPGETGELAVIYDRKSRFLALGLFDAGSPIRFRSLQVGEPQNIDRDWWLRRLVGALQTRNGLFDPATTGYRCINGESDGWPGLVLDRYDTTLALKLYSAAWLPRQQEILGIITQQLKPERVVLRLSRNIQAEAQNRFNLKDGDVTKGPPLSGPVTFLESGLRFEADVLRGQKTGFFLDQRENRRLVEKLARGCDVLNAFSFSGGFSLYAARGGARSVTDVDISRHALDAARRNFELNSADPAIAACRHELAQADAFEWLAASAKRRFDLIILDPPSLAKREAERAGALRAYNRLARLGLNRLAPGGILVACSCSAHVSAAEFFDVIRKAARSAGRFEELRTNGHPPDHPATFKEAEYLKAIFLRTGVI
jgi:23S rRNA (cytosine1962-C5)-methyltransferase